MNQLKEGQTAILKNQRALGDNSSTLARRATWILGGLICVSMALNFYMFIRWEITTKAIQLQNTMLYAEIQSIREGIAPKGQ